MKTPYQQRIKDRNKLAAKLFKQFTKEGGYRNDKDFQHYAELSFTAANIWENEYLKHNPNAKN